MVLDVEAAEIGADEEEDESYFTKYYESEEEQDDPNECSCGRCDTGEDDYNQLMNSLMRLFLISQNRK